MSEIQDVLAANEMFAGASEAALKTLSARAAPLRRENGQVIFDVGDPSDALYAVISGRIRVFRPMENGEEVSIAYIEAGGLLGEIAVLDGGIRTASAAAVGKTELARIAKNDFMSFLTSYPEIAVVILNVVCRRLRTTLEQVESLALLGLEARLARLVLSLCDSYGKPVREGGVLIDLRLGQRELGAFIAASRESVSKQMALWRAEGLVDKQDGRIVVRDRDGLAERAQSGESFG